MHLLSLAASNVWRRISRTMLTVLATAVAAMVFTAGLSLSQGSTKLAYAEYAMYFGGEVLVYSPGFIGAGPYSPNEENLARRVLPDSGFNPLLRYYPDFDSVGYFAQEDWVYAGLSKKDLQALATTAGVTDVQPYLAMPATTKGQDIILRIPYKGFEGCISEGRFVDDNATTLEVVLNAYGNVPNINLNDLIEVHVPAFTVDNLGVPHVNKSLPARTYQAQVVGFVSMPTRVLMFDGAIEQGYVHSREFFISEQAWRAIWYEQSQGTGFSPLMVGLKLQDMGELQPRALNIRQSFSHLSVFPVSQLIAHTEKYGLVDRFYKMPPSMWKGEELREQPYASRDFGRLTAIFLFLNAGMLMASQMLAAVTSRRKEIGILKAIGARQRDVVGMILIEAVVIALIGTGMGFGLVRLAALHQSLTNSHSVILIAQRAVRELGIVTAVTVGVALIFGVLPAWHVAKLTAMEVFRNE